MKGAEALAPILAGLLTLPQTPHAIYRKNKMIYYEEEVFYLLFCYSLEVLFCHRTDLIF